MKKKLLIVLTVIVLVLLVVLTGIGNYMVNFAIVRTETPPDVAPQFIVTDDNVSEIELNRAVVNEQKQAWISSATVERKEIVSDDGLTLVAEVYRTALESHRWLLGVHGYTSQKGGFSLGIT